MVRAHVLRLPAAGTPRSARTGRAPAPLLRRLRFAVWGLLLIGTGALAQVVDAPAEYVVRPGDTLLTLARVYMNNVSDYLTVQKLNNVRDPRHIPVGDTLVIPTALLKTEPLIGQISSFRGTVTIDGQPVSLGMKVQQGMRIETGASAFVTVKLPDNSAISLPSQSRLFVQRLRRVMLTGSVDRNFRLEAGRSRSTVTPFKDPASNFRVSTPLSVSAVRGTDFRVAMDEDGGQALTEVVGGTVGVAPDQAKAETAVHKAFGVIGTSSGVSQPIALLPPPLLRKVEKTADGVAISADPVDGAKTYRTQLATDVAFQDIFAEKITEQPAVDFTLAPDARFYVRLTAIAGTGMEGMPRTYALGSVGVPANAGGPSGAGAH